MTMTCPLCHGKGTVRTIKARKGKMNMVMHMTFTPAKSLPKAKSYTYTATKPSR